MNQTQLKKGENEQPTHLPAYLCLLRVCVLEHNASTNDLYGFHSFDFGNILNFVMATAGGLLGVSYLTSNFWLWEHPYFFL